jgi:hypothetical protein
VFQRTKCIRCLIYFNSINKKIIRLIDGFKDLYHASFYSEPSLLTTEETYSFDSNSNTSRERFFKSRLYIRLGQNCINLWLKEQITISQNVRTSYWLLQRGYHWYRICNLDFHYNAELVYDITMLLFIFEEIVRHMCIPIFDIVFYY